MAEPKNAGDSLFKSQPKRVQALRKAGEKAIRLKERAQWWRRYGKDAK